MRVSLLLLHLQTVAVSAFIAAGVSKQHRGTTSTITTKNEMAARIMPSGVSCTLATGGNQDYRRSSSSSSSTQLTAVSPRILASAAAGTVAAATAFVKLVLDRPSRVYDDNSVAKEYDAWADDGILEYYWGEHIHLGYYDTPGADFLQAKYVFIDKMMEFGNIAPGSSAKVLDVGCGFGGTSRYLAKKLDKDSHVTGITLSPRQVERGTKLAKEQGLAEKTTFTVMNALAMDFPDNTFDVVWACESGEHMPDKKKYIDEMMRVLKPGGKFVMACWSQRSDKVEPFDKRDKRDLLYLYEEWTHPYFISVEEWAGLMEGTGLVTPVKTANWVKETIKSWRHSIWVGVVDPRGWIFKPRTYMKCVRDAYCLERMHRAFKRGLMEYGMFATTKKKVLPS
jgi:MPBQ/MSBQ methyltransferase